MPRLKIRSHPDLLLRKAAQYGQFAVWGYGNNNDLGTTAARDADLYHVEYWNPARTAEPDRPRRRLLGQPQYASALVRNEQQRFHLVRFAGEGLRCRHTQRLTHNCQNDSCVSNFLANPVSNPFYPMFSSPCTPTPSAPCFNEPNSLYSAPQIPLGYLLNPYPQFTGDFEGLMIEEASSWYNAMQVRFEKRTTHHISFEGNYTISKMTDNSSAGRNNWVGSLGKWNAATTRSALSGTQHQWERRSAAPGGSRSFSICLWGANNGSAAT